MFDIDGAQLVVTSESTHPYILIIVDAFLSTVSLSYRL